MDSNQLIPIGIAVIFVWMFLVFFGALSGTQKADTKVAVDGFIGFIPFGFANDKKLLYIVIGISIFFIMLWIWFFLRR